MMESAIGERATESLVEEQEQERDVNALGCQAVSVAAAITLQQAVPFELAQIVPELVESVLFRGKLECGDDCLVNLFGRPAADGAPVMEENFQKPDDPV
jgi:hypothetical protein